MTIEDLATKSNLSPRNIKKYESPSEGQSSKPNERTIKGLCEALVIEAGHLSGELELPEEFKKRRSGKTTRRSISLREGRKQELELIQRVYGLKPEQVLNMAPFLFVLLAEGSLQWRSEKIAGIERALDDCENINHLTFLHGSIHDFSVFMESEKGSIRNRDLFGKKLYENNFYPNFEQDDGNPFSDYLCELHSEIVTGPDRTNILDVEHSMGADEIPYYTLLEGEMDKICAGNSLCREAIRWGDISIGDIPEGLQNNPDEFNSWVEAKASDTVKVMVSSLAEIVADMPESEV